MTRICGLILLMAISFSGSLPAAMIASQDKHGAKDHPLVSRYPGSFIYGYNATDYDQYAFVTGPLENKQLPTQPVEGKYTTIVYSMPDNLSTFQVLKNYQQAFAKAGVKQVMSCNQSTCGSYLPKKFIDAQGDDNKVFRYIGVDVYSTSKNADYRFWTGVLERNGAKTYITFMVYKNSSSVSSFLDIVEASTLKTGLVKLDLNSMDVSLKSEGKVILSGLFFDHDMAVLKPKSKDSLDVIAKYLAKNPSMKAFVVGHTDSSGNYGHNIELSQQRASAVVKALTDNYKIAPSRLTPVGIGPVSPATSNSSKESKAQNRRVELVIR